MMRDRRSLLAATGVLLAGPALAQGTVPAIPDPRTPGDPRLGERATGRADAPMTVIEYFSLTCSHCGAFHRDTWPRVNAELVRTGKVRMVWRDFPLDQVALRAHAVARAFPTERYEAFLSALFATQDRWAYARGVDHKAEIGKVALLAGMTQAAFDAAWADDDLARAILALRAQGEAEHRVQATPTFVFGTRVVSGAIPFDRFAREAQAS